MKGFYNIPILIVAFVMLALTTSTCVSPTPPPTPMPTATEPSRITPLPEPTATSVGPADGESIMHSNCTGCHTLERIVSSKKTRDQWDQTVRRMAHLSSNDQATLIDYLAKTYKP
jgi:cytochrome c5